MPIEYDPKNCPHLWLDWLTDTCTRCGLTGETSKALKTFIPREPAQESAGPSHARDDRRFSPQLPFASFPVTVEAEDANA